MRPLVMHVFLAAVLSCAVTSCHKDGEVIPRAKFSRLYADMLVADSWLQASGSEVRQNADTTAFYEPIFRKYGYTTKDYLASVEYYLNDPGRFGRILRRTSAILESDIDAFNIESEREKFAKENEEKRFGNREQFSRDMLLYPELLRRLPFTDCINIALDAEGVFYPAGIVEDTMFSGPRIILNSDSLSIVSDTVADPNTALPVERSAERGPSAVPRRTLPAQGLKTDGPMKAMEEPILVNKPL